MLGDGSVMPTFFLFCFFCYGASNEKTRTLLCTSTILRYVQVYFEYFNLMQLNTCTSLHLQYIHFTPIYLFVYNALLKIIHYDFLFIQHFTKDLNKCYEQIYKKLLGRTVFLLCLPNSYLTKPKSSDTMKGTSSLTPIK